MLTKTGAAGPSSTLAMKEDLLTHEVPLHAKKKMKTEGQFSPLGVLLDSVTKQLDLLSIHEMEVDLDGDNDVLNTTLIYEGEVDEDASDDECKKRKKKIKKWDKKVH